MCLYVYAGCRGTYVQAHFKSQVKGLNGMISIGVAFILLHHISGRPFTFTPLFSGQLMINLFRCEYCFTDVKLRCILCLRGAFFQLPVHVPLALCDL